MFIYAELMPRMEEPLVCTNTFDSSRKITFTSPKVLECNRNTGLKDKNGKEIYEGDILEWRMKDNDGSIMKELCMVSWNNGSFITVDKGKNKRWAQATEESIYDGGNRKQITKQSIVIGNIYENPELLN